jgi:hypothetical protein
VKKMNIDYEVQDERARLINRPVRYRAGTTFAGENPAPSNFVIAVYREPDDGEPGNRTGGTIWAIYANDEVDVASRLEPVAADLV